jgi:Arc/MetJ-type ribon-helix-helix transcriptional regulator
MNVHLTPDLERIVNDELRSGGFRSVEEVIAKALAVLREKKSAATAADGNRHQESAVRDMLAFVAENRTRLRDVSVKELIREGHRL